MRWEDVPSSGQLPGQGAGRPRPECPGPLPGRPRGRGRVHGRHLRRLPPLRHEGREARVPLWLRPLVHPVPLLGPEAEQRRVRRRAEGVGHRHERGERRGARGRAALRLGPREGPSEASARAAGLREDEDAEAGRLGDRVVHPRRPRPRLVRRGLVVLASRRRGPTR